MNIGVEVNFVVQDSIKALALYESIFEVRRVEVTEYPRGNNEAVFTIYGTRFHMLDENPQFMLIAPKLGEILYGLTLSYQISKKVIKKQ